MIGQLYHYVALINGLQIATDVTDMGTKSRPTNQHAVADESDINDEHDTLPVSDAPCVAGAWSPIRAGASRITLRESH